MEVGCGLGDLLQCLGKRGHTGIGIDLSDEAVNYAKSVLSCKKFVAINSDIDSLSDKYDIIIASEVLEHCKDDTKLLRKMTERLDKNGKIIITVPAHMDDWYSNDDFCGHLRRYEKAQSIQLVISVGLQDVVIHSYGFPLFNILKPIYSIGIKSKIDRTKAIEDRTKDSGGMWVMSGLKMLFSIIFNDLTMSPFYLLQKLFYRQDIGKGYCASGVLKNV